MNLQRERGKRKSKKKTIPKPTTTYSKNGALSTFYPKKNKKPAHWTQNVGNK